VIQFLARHAVQILSWAVVLFLLPLSPLLGSVGSIVASVCAIALLPALFVAGGWRDASRAPAMVLFPAAFVVLALAFAVTARRPHDLAYAVNFIALALAPIVYVVARRAPGGSAAVTTIAALCLAATLVGLASAANDILLLHLPRLDARLMGPNMLARLELLFGFLALSGLLATRSRWRFLLYLAPLAALVATYLSGTRGALLAIPLEAAVLAVVLWVDRRDRAQVWALAAVAVAAVAALMLASDRFASVVGVFGDLLSGTASADGAVTERQAMLWGAWQLFWASPIVGHGWANFAAVAYPILQGSAVWGGPTDPFFQFHNDLANFAVAAGAVGIACYIAILAAPIVGALMSPRDRLFRVRLYCGLQLSVTTLVYGMTDFKLGYDLPTTIYAFLTAIVLGAFVERPGGKPATPAAAAQQPPAALAA
jgi:O-antigen ligase